MNRQWLDIKDEMLLERLAFRTCWGIDGCAGGWFVVGISVQSGKLLLHWYLKKYLHEVFTLLHPGEPVLIDMPIGLKSVGSSRKCDDAARRLLTPSRASSIFPAPCRQVLDAEDYESANEINRKCIGKGLSKQTWFLVPKIKALDTWLRQHPQWQDDVHESHPELCYMAKHGSPMKDSKKSEAGIRARLEVLKAFLSSEPLDHVIVAMASAYLRKQLKVDDILDAMVLAATAARGCWRIVPETHLEEFDAAGLNMKITMAENGV